MAKLYGEIAAKALLTLDKSFARANGQPLDASEVYYSLDAAKAYAATAQAYIGQKIVVIEDNVVTHYSVEDTAGNLKELGAAVIGDENSITINDDGSISLYGIDSLIFERDIIGEDGQPTGEKESVQYQPLMTKSGLVWVEPSKTTVEGLNALLEVLTKRVDTLEDTVDSLEFTGVAADDKVLSITNKLISSTISLEYDEDKKAIKLYGKADVEGNKAELGSVDATPFIKDGMLEDVDYNADNNTLIFKWNTAAGITEDTVVLSDIIEPYAQGNGIEINGNSIKIKLAENSESFLTVSEAGLKLSGVQDAINTAKQAAIDDAAGKYATKAAAESNATAVENLSGRIDDIVAGGGEPNTINSIKINGIVQTIAEDKSVDITVPVDFSDLNDDSGFGDRITVAEGNIDKLEGTVGDSTKGLVKDVADLKVAVGEDEIYILDEGETIEDAPGEAKEIIDPYAENTTVDLGQFAKKTGWTANKYIGTDASGNMVEKEAPQTGTGGITEETDPTVPTWAKQPEKPTYTKSEISLGNVDNVRQYSASNPPPYPVTSVNGKTGVVSLGASDVGAATTEQFERLSEAIDDCPKFITPQMYGAVGDGVTDDTAAFTQALAENDNVYVPSGNYLITSALNISYKKGLYSDDGQRATIYFNGNGSVVNLGRLSVFRNINIRFKNAFVGTVFNTHNNLINSGQSALESRVGHTNIFFEVASPDAVLIGITVDSGTDPNNIPRLRGTCYQTYHDICVEYGSESYGIGIKMELIQGRAFTEETKEGFPWITHIDYDDIFLGSPYTAIKAGATVAEGVEHFNRVGMGHLLFNNVSTQYRASTSTRYFLDVDHFGGYFTKCIGWDYYPLGWNGEKCNIIGEDVSICLSDCEMEFGKEFLKSCDFTTETEFSVENNPEYFVKKYFGGTVLKDGYDSVDAKIDSRLTDAYVGEIAEEKVNEILYSGYVNILDDPLTQIKVGLRWSGSGQEWTAGAAGSDKKTTVIIPIVQGGNIIRWTPPTYICGESYQTVYFFNSDDLSDGVAVDSFTDIGVSDGVNAYLQIDNPSGYKYVSIPFDYYTDISSETMTMTINREITSESGQSYSEYLNESVIIPAVTSAVIKAVENIDIPTKTSDLENDSGFLTGVPSEYVTEDELNSKGYLTSHQDISGKADKSSAETWTFTLSDGSTVTKKVVLVE